MSLPVLQVKTANVISVVFTLRHRTTTNKGSQITKQLATQIFIVGAAIYRITIRRSEWWQTAAVALGDKYRYFGINVI